MSAGTAVRHAQVSPPGSVTATEVGGCPVRVWETAAPSEFEQRGGTAATALVGSARARQDTEGPDRAEALGADGSKIVALHGVLPRPRAPDVGSFILLQQFEGTVIALGDDEFTARLVDRTNPENAPEVGEFSTDDVSEGDRELLALGAVFYFSLGYRIAPWGQRDRVATIKFRRLPAWSKREIEAASAQAETWAEMFDDADS